MIPYVLTASDDEEALARGAADIGSLQVARVYAEALLNAAERANQVDEMLGELEALLQLTVAPGSVLRPFFASGVIGRATRGDVIRKVFDGRAHPLLVDFLLVVNDHDRLTLLPAILFETKELRDRRAGRLPVTVHSAVPLAHDQVERIRQGVRNRLRVEPVLEMKVDPELIGGIQVRIGDWVFDGTLRNQLSQIRDQIISRSSHEIQSRRDRFSSTNGN